MERAELRHTSEALLVEINESIRRYREKVSDAGHHHFLQSHSGRLTPGAAVDPSDGETQFAWGVLELGVLDPAVVRIYGIDVRNGQRIDELTGIEWKQRNYYQDRFASSDFPQAFFVYDAATVGLVPPPNAAYAYTLWYLPDIRDLVGESDVFDPGLVGGEKWVVWDVCHKLASRDNYPPMIIAADAGRAKVETDIISRAGKISMVGTMRRLDTKGRNAQKGWRSRWPWGG